MAADSKSWDFGIAQAKVKVENGQLTWSLIGNGGSTYPMSSVTGIQFEKGGFLSVMGAFVILVAGGDNRRVQVPNKDRSAEIVADINKYILACHAASAPGAQAATVSVSDELLKLVALRDAGVLSTAEFEQQKQRVLNA